MDVFERMTFDIIELQEFIDEYNLNYGEIIEIKVRPNEKMLVRVDGELRKKLLAYDDLEEQETTDGLVEVSVEKDNTIFYTLLKKKNLNTANLAAGICIELGAATICPYCTESKPIYYDGHLQVEIKGTDLCIHCVTSDFGRVHYQLQIKHCPECGGKL